MSSTITVDGVTYGENMIRHLQQQVNDCRERGFIDDAGNVRKVLGTLALTADGCVVGRGAAFYFTNSAGHIYEKFVASEIIDLQGNRFSGYVVYSTKEAASAARSNS